MGVLSGLFLLMFWWLTCYTNHGESVQVPNYVGMSIREASKKARSRNFSVAISDSIYMSGKPPGQVLDQHPKPDSKVKEGRTIYLTIAKFNPDVIKLPALVDGDNYDLYSRKLINMGLNPRIVARVPKPDYNANTIMAVIYHGDTITEKIRNRRDFTVRMEESIDFVVSEKVMLNVNIPDCVCQTYNAAKFLIQTSNLVVGAVIKDATVSDPETAYVWRQSPGFDENGMMRVGEQLDLYLTQDKPKACDH